MTFFESLLALLMVAIVLLQVARRLSLPYPTMLAGAGVIVALIPGAPLFSIDPETCLALFIAPAVVDAAFDFPLGATRRFLAPLVTYAVVAVALTAVIVALIAHMVLHLPWAAGLALGAIVAPPDAAAATAILRRFAIPRATDAVLKGESLFNDATALLLYSGALTVLHDGGLSIPVGVRLAVAAPGGLLLGIICGYLFAYVNRIVKDTLGGVLLQFVNAYILWVVADHLHLSAVLCVIGLAMTLANRLRPEDLDARMRVQSFAVWTAVVFTLNVLAFLLMGMQARMIVSRMQGEHLREALLFAAVIVATVIVTRMVVVLSFTFAEARVRRIEHSLNQAVFVGWCGMRGFVTIATAFALPEEFPHRDTVVLTAFSVVLATLVLQGLTLTPLVRLLHLDRSEEAVQDLATARVDLAQTALDSIAEQDGPEADNLRYRLTMKLRRCLDREQCGPVDRLREVGLIAVRAERERLDGLRDEDSIGPDAYLGLQEQLDWNELTLLRDGDRKIEEI
ncbi:cation:proton antiporter [Silvibacterium acidisoli]|uniref:cation:proton antiporter n=1 Tax=Acidobacteriaceae bacterium ZG23-2 TaxID=2883246 RepID=UPI00406C3F4A